ncbi:MAG: hypothetical protein U9P11_09970 [Pseudomonadota bacterium]|nr:hypothetical protein [Pseudomonadota bacterium]
MTRDRRENKKLTQNDVQKILNRKQLAALLECQHFGWRLKFIRTPLLKEPVPVLYNSRIDKIGILDPDGHINMDLELEVRSCKPKPDQAKQSPQVQKAPEAASWIEKRKDMAPVPDNFDELLNQHQMRTLRQFEMFGWQLHFVRRPLFQEPVPVILSPEGDKFATLESDGRINMTPDSALRKEAPDEQAESVPSVPVSEIKRA